MPGLYRRGRLRVKAHNDALKPAMTLFRHPERFFRHPGHLTSSRASPVIPDLIRDPVHRNRVEITGFFVPERHQKAWCGMKSRLKSSRSRLRKRYRVEIGGVFDPERALKTCCGSKSRLKSSRSRLRKGYRVEIAGFFVPVRALGKPPVRHV